MIVVGKVDSVVVGAVVVGNLVVETSVGLLDRDGDEEEIGAEVGMLSSISIPARSFKGTNNWDCFLVKDFCKVDEKILSESFK